MGFQISSHDLLTFLVFLSAVALFLIALLALYRRYKRRKRMDELKDNIKENARDILNDYNKRKQTNFNRKETLGRGLPELTDDNSNNSILNINKLLERNNKEGFAHDIEGQRLNIKNGNTIDTDKSYSDDDGYKSYMSE